MPESSSFWRRRPTVATLVGAVLVILGFLLAIIDWRFLALSALGTFGPGILREWGWVKDKDEFQMQAVHRAGYHAYLAGGLTAFMLVGIIRSAGEAVEHAGELVTVVLAVLWFTWLLSSLYSYWGPRRTVSRILLIFGSVWLLFNVIANIGHGGMALVMQSLLAAPFFLLAWVSRRWPPVGSCCWVPISQTRPHCWKSEKRQ
ncbi:MAG: hypothetical protein KAH56_05335 [Candidatus Krumholzibacteria bacterium]|nr:hypothetical protein [Candidatus Krumholzibacteria bacterium]